MDLKNWGVNDLFVARVDWRRGFADRIRESLPESIFQCSIVHLVRSMLKYVTFKDSRPMLSVSKQNYRAKSIPKTEKAVEELDKIFE